MQKIAVLISGRGSNMGAIIQQSLTGCLKGLCRVVVVASNRLDAEGLTLASRYGVPSICVESKDKSRKAFEGELIARLLAFDVEWVILAGFMRVLTSTFLSHYRGKVINIHPADTVQHQGIDGYEWAYREGLEKTYITVHKVDEGVDTGSIIAQAPVDLKGANSLAEVKQRGLCVEHKFYSRVIEQVLREECVAFLE